MTKKYQINSIYEQKNSIKRFYDKIKFDDNHPTNPYGCEWSNYLEEEYTFLHYHDCLELGISHEGTGIFHINEKSIRFDGPTISIIFPSVFHSAHRICKQDCLWNFVYVNSTELLNDFYERNIDLKRFENFSLILPKNKNPELFSLVELFISIAYHDFNNKNQLLSNILKSIIYLTAEYHNDYSSNLDLESFNIILPAINYINQNYNKKITNEEMACLCNTSLSSLRRKFIEVTKYTPYEYIERTRIKIAKNLLKFDDKISFIAYKCGFQTISCFNKCFKKITGITPKNYQTKIRNIKKQ